MKRVGLGVLVAGLMALVAAFVLATVTPIAAAWCAVAGLAATTSGTFLMAGSSGRRSPTLLLAAIATAVVIVAGLGAAMLLPAEAAGGPLLLGLPRRAAIVLIGVGLVPMAILPWAHARDGARDSPEELARFVAECRRMAEATEEG